MNRDERILIWLLRMDGVLMLSALGAVVMPFAWMNAIHQPAGLAAMLLPALAKAKEKGWPPVTSQT